MSAQEESLRKSQYTTNADALDPFPAGIPRPDHARNWGRKTESVLAARRLTDIAQGKITPGIFPPIWSARSIKDPEPLPEGASFRDKAAYESWACKIEERKGHNKQIKLQRETYWRDKNNELFTLLTDSMMHTNPGLREILRSKYHTGDGYYDGAAALKFVELWLLMLQRDSPQNDFYEKAARIIQDKRLPEGCGDREFQAVCRRFAYDINPFLRAPYTGEQLGEFVINKILPRAYDEAAERLLDELRKEDLLGEYEVVLNRCSRIVQRRASAKAPTGAAHAIDVAAGFVEAQQPPENEVDIAAAGTGGAGRPPKTEKATVDPKKGVFCTGCPHKNRQGEILKCACDPREELHGGMKVLRLMAWTDPDLAKLTETRAQFAKLLGITAKPLPKIEKPLQPFGRGNGNGGRGGRGGGRGGRGSPQNAADVEEIIELIELVSLVELVDDADTHEDAPDTVMTVGEGELTAPDGCAVILSGLTAMSNCAQDAFMGACSSEAAFMAAYWAAPRAGVCAAPDLDACMMTGPGFGAEYHFGLRTYDRVFQAGLGSYITGRVTGMLLASEHVTGMLLAADPSYDPERLPEVLHEAGADLTSAIARCVDELHQYSALAIQKAGRTLLLRRSMRNTDDSSKLVDEFNMVRPDRMMFSTMDCGQAYVQGPPDPGMFARDPPDAESAEPAWLTEAHSLLKITAEPGAASAAWPGADHGGDSDSPDDRVTVAAVTCRFDGSDPSTVQPWLRDATAPLREMVTASNRVPVCSPSRRRQSRAS